MASSSEKPLLERMKERKLVQWALGYLAGGFVVLQLMDALEGPLGLSQFVQQGVLVLLLAGFPVALVLAWYHGEQGRQRVSGPELLIIAGLLVVAGIGFRVLLSDDSAIEVAATASPETDAPVQPSVAVLPFVNMSGNPDNEYFSDGITEELLNALAQLPGLRVPGRTSSFAFKGQNITIRQIADTLDVAHVLEGSVRRDEDRVLITAQLVEAETDTHLWSDTYEREIEDIFAIQREIAQAIVGELQVTLSADRQTQLVAEATESTQAYEAYLRGRHFMSQRTGEALRIAIREFETAVDLDPDYAEAYSGLADSHLLMGFYSGSVDEEGLREDLERGRSAAQTAVSLAPDQGMAHASLALGDWIGGDWEEAEREFAQAIELSPGYPAAHHWYSQFLWSTGRPVEALPRAKRALELDPVSLINSVDLGMALWLTESTQEGIEQFRETTQLAPNGWVGWVGLAVALFETEQYGEGLDAWGNYVRVTGSDGLTLTQGYEAAVGHRTSSAQEASPDLGTTPGSPAVGVWLYGQMGQVDRAMEIVEAYTRPGTYGIAAFIDAWFGRDLLGDDPRYQALLEEAGITW